MGKTATFYAKRLQDNRDKAVERLTLAESRLARLQEDGVDTSTFDARTSAQSPDFTVSKLRVLAETAQRELDKYLAAHPGALDND